MSKLNKKHFKKQNAAVFVLCFVWMFSLSESILHAQTIENVTWEYPVIPGSEEWRFMPYTELVEKLQPPKELLNSWDTETLFRYCIDYPLNRVTLMYSSYDFGFMRAYGQSTVWQEFIRRKDAIEPIAQHFEARSYKRLFEMDSIELRNGEFFHLFFLEKLVSETDFTDHLDSSDKRKLANIILQSHLSKKDYTKYFSGSTYNSSLSALLKILESDKDEEISRAEFREKTNYESFVNGELESAITTKVFNYLNNRQL